MAEQILYKIKQIFLLPPCHTSYILCEVDTTPKDVLDVLKVKTLFIQTGT